MSNHEPGSQPVTLLLGNVPVSTLNPLPTTGGGGGGGGVVTQGAGSGIPTGAWTTRLSNGTAFYNALTDAELRASAAETYHHLRRLVDSGGGAEDEDKCKRVTR